MHGEEHCAHCVDPCGYATQCGYIFLTNAATIELHLRMRYLKLYMHNINLLDDLRECCVSLISDLVTDLQNHSLFLQLHCVNIYESFLWLALKMMCNIERGGNM